MSSPRPRPLRRVLVSVAAATALAGSVGVATPLSALGAGSDITGTVSGPSSMDTIEVRVIGVDDTKPAAVQVQPDGTYSAPWADGPECGWVEAFSTDGHWTTARTDEPVCAGEAAPTLTLAPAGAVSGTVSAGTGTPASSVLALNDTLDVAAQAPVGEDGTYLLGGLPAGSYRIAFDHRGPDHAVLDTTWSTTNETRWYSGSVAEGLGDLDWTSATEVAVTENATVTGVDVTMTPGGSVSGTLTCLDGTPAASVEAYADPTEGWPLTSRLAYSRPATGGAWSATGLTNDAAYRVEAFGCDATPTNHRDDLAVYSGNTLNPNLALPGLGGESTEQALDLRTARLFTDVAANTLFVADMQWLVGSGIANGYPDGSFRPVTSVRRDAMAAFLFRMDPNSSDFVPPVTSPFADITPSTQFYKEMCWLYTEGISTGWVSGGRRYYRPGLAVARDAMAAFLYRFAYEPPFTETYRFADVTPSTSFHKEMNWMFDAGISTGWVSGGKRYYRPLSTVNRDAMAAFLHRLDSWFIDQAPLAAPSSAAQEPAPKSAQRATADGSSGSAVKGGLVDANRAFGRSVTTHR